MIVLEENPRLAAKHNVRDFGAVGDGKTLDTAAIQAAIDAGGTVFFPPGVYLSGTIYLHDDSGLELSVGATLLASPDPRDYNRADFTSQNRASAAEMTFGGHLIVAVECSGLLLCGGGRICGNDRAFLHEPEPELPQFFKRAMRPGAMLYFCESENIRIHDLELSNSPYWHLFLHGCENVMLRNLRINGDPRVLNNDGIDIDCCRNVTVSCCMIETADDAVAVRGNSTPLKKKRPCENILVSDCILRSSFANTIRVGVGGGEIRNVFFKGLLLLGYRSAINIVCNWNASQEAADIHDIEFRDIHTSARRPFSLMLGNLMDRQCVQEHASIRNVRFSGITGTGELSNRIIGNGGGGLSHIVFENIDLTYGGIGAAPDSDANGNWGHQSGDAVFDLRRCSDVSFRRVRIDYAPGVSGWRTECSMSDSQNVTMEQCSFPLIAQPEEGVLK